MPLRRWLTLTLLFPLALALAGCPNQNTDDPDPEARVEEPAPPRRGPLPVSTPAPDFSLETPEGDSFTLSDHRGQVVVINFWATWCAPCVVEVPELMEVQEEFADQGLVIVGVSQDTGPEASVDVRDFIEMFEVNYPMVLDPELQVGRSYGGHISLPTTFVVDRQGVIRARRVGLLTREDILSMLATHIEIPRGHEARLQAVPVAPDSNLPGSELEYSDEPVAFAPTALPVSAAARLVETGAMVVDLREESERRLEGVIPYALIQQTRHLERSDLPANLAAPVLFVSTDEAEAWGAARRAASWGYARSHPLAGGFAAWKDAGMPVEPYGLYSSLSEAPE